MQWIYQPYAKRNDICSQKQRRGRKDGKVSLF